mgnify:CR=1 FL=1
MSQQRQPLRPLPSFSRWAQGLWAFAHKSITYFASKDAHGLWSVVSEDRQGEPISWNQPSKAEAVRIALDRIDRYGADYRPSNAPRSDVLGGTTGATT